MKRDPDKARAFQQRGRESLGSALRAPLTKRCEQCKAQFTARDAYDLRRRRFCSRACQFEAQRRPVERTCEACGETFTAKAGEVARGKAKFCSFACSYKRSRLSPEQYERQAAVLRVTRRGSGNPMFVDGVTDRHREWLATRGSQCTRCGIGVGAIDLHHVVYEQHVRDAGGEVYDPRDGLTLCRVCHAAHHGQQDRGKVPLSLLRDENYEFAFELLGPAAFDYLRRRYAGNDRRLHDHLERLVGGNGSHG